MKRTLLSSLGLLAHLTLTASGAQTSSGKLIATGWDNPDTAQFRRDLHTMERWPFSGAVLWAKGKLTDGRTFDARTAFGVGAWPSNAFEAATSDLKGAHSQVLTDNFLLFGANPGNIDWFDDAGWSDIRQHCRLLARLAREGGLKGLLFDPEPYTEPHKQFCYRQQAGRDRRSFAEYCAKTRQRGGELMAAMGGEFPEIVVYSYFLVGQCATAAEPGNPMAKLEPDGYGLLPAFTDGMLDALPPSATLIDGNESAYRYNDPREFNLAFVRIKNVCQRLISPKNRAKYRAQLQVSHGIYLDAYVNAPSSPWYIDGLGGPRVWRLEENAANALRAADEYVWIYGEKGRWWPPAQPGARSYAEWPEVLPGADLALLSAHDPAAGAVRYLEALRKRGDPTNCLTNGDFSLSGTQPASWGAWQDEKTSHGTFAQDAEKGAIAKGSALLAGIENGCFVQSFPGEPGERFVVAANTRQEGSGTAWLTIRWQTTEGRWTAEDRDIRLVPEPSKAGDWALIIGQVTIPPGAGRLVVLLGASGQRNSNDRIWFDDALAVKIERK